MTTKADRFAALMTKVTGSDPHYMQKCLAKGTLPDIDDKPSVATVLECYVQYIHRLEKLTIGDVNGGCESYITATRILNFPFANRDGEPADKNECSKRYEQIAKAEADVFAAVWQGTNVNGAEKKLASLLYKPKESLNVAVGVNSAKHIAADIVQAAREVKQQLFGVELE